MINRYLFISNQYDEARRGFALIISDKEKEGRRRGEEQSSFFSCSLSAVVLSRLYLFSAYAIMGHGTVPSAAETPTNLSLSRLSVDECVCVVRVICSCFCRFNLFSQFVLVFLLPQISTFLHTRVNRYRHKMRLILDRALSFAPKQTGVSCIENGRRRHVFFDLR